ncbi:MAG TPA: amidohydrolase family protein [Thermoanaerobaculia bacterium]|nr:amidohydrolase family protein [Thermoanaerobaculia bacterium]
MSIRPFLCFRQIPRSARPFAVFSLFALASLGNAEPAVVSASAPHFAIVHVRLFDGLKVTPDATVLIEGGKIVAVGPKVKVPADAETIDGAGKTLLPGLIDSHAHTWGNALERALAFGVTTQLDMFSDPKVAQQRREEQAKDGAPDRADLYSAGTLATAPGGHGTQFGSQIPTLTKPEEADAFVAARFAEGSDYLKIVVEDGKAWAMTFPTLDAATVAALAKAAHARGKLAVAHIGTEDEAMLALNAGVDGLVHLFEDRAPDPEFAALAKRNKAFVVPTLTILESATAVASGKALNDDPRFAGYLSDAERATLGRSFVGGGKVNLSNAFAAVRDLAAAGVPILAGSDAPNPSATYGASVHREMELLVKAGLTPIQALVAATSAPATAFRLKDRGRIAPGLRADLVLVEGDPTTEITSTRAIVGIWKLGHRFERPKFETAAAASSLKPELPPSGRIADFEQGKLASAIGAGWFESTDQVMRGKSTVKVAVVDGGASGSTKSIEIGGEIQPGAAFPWAGAALYVGRERLDPADLSDVASISFFARGDGGTYQLMMFAKSLGRIPAMRTFVAGPDWQRFTFSLAELTGESRDIQMFFWGAGQAVTGPFKLQIDEVSLEAKQ